MKKTAERFGLLGVLAAAAAIASRYLDRYVGPADTHLLFHLGVIRADQFLGLLVDGGKALIHLIV